MDERMPLIGDTFPQFEVVTTQGRMTIPDIFIDKWFILFSHPADFTPVCTTEFHAFQKKYEEFRALDTELIGLSIDQVFSHIKWMDWIRDNLNTEISFPIIADDGTISRKLGFIHPGKAVNTVRAVFIADPESRIRAILYYPQELGRNIDEILRMIKALRVHDEYNVSLPANWPQNDLIHDQVIVPPATDVLTARERLQKYDSYDWWFCYKKI